MIGAVISASVAVIVAIVTQVFASVRARTDRLYLARRAALIDAQDAGLELRQALLLYGQAVPHSVSATSLGTTAELPAEVDAGRVRAQGRFAVAVSRVHDQHVARALRLWTQIAEVRYIDVSDVSAAVEDSWFRHVNALAAAAMSTKTCDTTERQRSTLREPELPAGIGDAPVAVPARSRLAGPPPSGTPSLSEGEPARTEDGPPTPRP